MISQASRLARHTTKGRFHLLLQQRITTPTITITLTTKPTNTTKLTPTLLHLIRSYTTTPSLKMPESISHKTLDAKTDPSVSQQYDTKTPISEQFQDLYKIIDKQKICMMTTLRSDIGDLPVSRCMAVSKRLGPDLLFLANKHSSKFQDLEQNNGTVMISFHDNSSQDWVSISGKVTSTSNDDPRIKELYSPMISAWFGDVGDGVHNGTAEDPRMALIEVQAKYVAYWKKETGSLGFVAEVAQAAFQGDVAQTGSMRQLFEADLEKERKSTPAMKGGNDSSTASVS